jgi:hypothetical protein
LYSGIFDTGSSAPDVMMFVPSQWKGMNATPGCTWPRPLHGALLPGPYLRDGFSFVPRLRG